jgi:hypothetical protein
MKGYKHKFKSYNLEEIYNRQMSFIKSHLIDFIGRNANGKTIDYTHTIDINFESRRHQLLKQLAILNSRRIFNQEEYARIKSILDRLSSVNTINYDFRAFLEKAKLRVDFDAFYLIPDENHIHMLIVLHNGDIKHLLRMAKNRPYCWDVKRKDFKIGLMDEWIANKIKYFMKTKNISKYSYEECIYDFYPNRERIDTFFDQYQTMYDYRIHEMGKALKEKMSQKLCN